MPLPPGTRLGPYEVVDLIGAGGMGEVYRARDSRLDRTVAIKILPADVASDAERRARFEREARTISALNHPHICALHDVGVTEGVPFLVMEHVDGETLAARLRKGALPARDALETAAQIADALDAAHRHGIVHRDLKPGNVMLTRAGAKLLDFGLAKPQLSAAAPGRSVASAATMAEPLTGRGVMLGTVPYMSPEQLEGREADARSDLWALGTILHETLTGRPAFEGAGQASLVAAIMERTPAAVSSLQPRLPAALDHVVGKCLEKEPDRRWQSASDLRDELRWILNSTSQSAAAVSRSVLSHRRRQRLALPVLAAALVLALAALAALWYRGKPSPQEPLVARLVLKLPEGQIPYAMVPQIAMSPDGRLLVYAAQNQGVSRLYSRRLDQFQATPIPGTEGAVSPFVAPDGQWIGFFAQNRLQKVSLGGGEPLTVAELEPGFIRSATWTRDGWIVFSNTPKGGLQRVSAGGGASESLATPDASQGELALAFPDALPDGDHVVFTSVRAGLGFGTHPIGVLSLSTRTRQTLTTDATMARVLDPGRLVGWNRGSSLLVYPFEPPYTSIGRGLRVLEGVAGGLGRRTGAFTVSGSGALAYLVEGPQRYVTRWQWIGRDGTAQSLTAREQRMSFPALSPDGKHVAFVLQTGADVQIWTLDVDHGSTSRVTRSGENHAPIWTPDARWLVFSSSREGGDGNLWRQRADGTGSAEPLSNSRFHQDPGSVTPDGRTLVYAEFGAGGSWDIAMLSLDGPANPRPVVHTDANECDPMLSPDGRWLAYSSTESGSYEVYAQSFPEGAGRLQVSNGGGREPLWSADGREIFFRAGDTLMSAGVERSPRLEISRPRAVFSRTFQHSAGFGHPGYSVSPDGRRFLVLEPVGDDQAGAAEVAIVLNWASEVRRLTGSEEARRWTPP